MMTAAEDKLEIKVPLETWVEVIIERTIEKHTKNCPVIQEIQGNGKPGLLKRMNRVEFWASVNQWIVGIFAIQLIIFVFWALKELISK